MKNIFIVLMLCIAVGCSAKDAGAQLAENNCQYTRANLSIKASSDTNVVNSFWQKTTGKYGTSTVDRLYLVFADGSSAVIDHNYCSMYSFSVVYYARYKDSINDEKKVAAIIDHLFDLIAVKVSFEKPLRQVIETALKSKSYDGQRAVKIDLPVENINKTDSIEYSLSYYPLAETDVAEGVIGFYMSVGGQQ